MIQGADTVGEWVSIEADFDLVARSERNGVI